MRSSGRLIVLSHRAPVEVSRNAPGGRTRRAAGGLPGALNAVMQERGGMWVAWTARSADEGTRQLARLIERQVSWLAAFGEANPTWMCIWRLARGPFTSSGGERCSGTTGR